MDCCKIHSFHNVFFWTSCRSCENVFSTSGILDLIYPMASYARVKIKKDQNLLNKTKQKLSRQFKLIRPMCSLYTCLRRNAPLEHDMYIYMCSEKSLKIIWNSHNLFEGRSPIVLRGRECIIFFQVLCKGFFLIILLE